MRVIIVRCKSLCTEVESLRSISEETIWCRSCQREIDADKCPHIQASRIDQGDWMAETVETIYNN